MDLDPGQINVEMLPQPSNTRHDTCEQVPTEDSKQSTPPPTDKELKIDLTKAELDVESDNEEMLSMELEEVCAFLYSRIDDAVLTKLSMFVLAD